jgi:hypothetical protein
MLTKLKPPVGPVFSQNSADMRVNRCNTTRARLARPWQMMNVTGTMEHLI